LRVTQVTPLDLAVMSGLLAVFFGFVVLLALLEQAGGRVVVSEVFRPFLIVFRGAILRPIPRVQLFQNLAARLSSVLPFGVILGTFLYSVAVLHQCGLLMYGVS
jgi:hypothetical protein